MKPFHIIALSFCIVSAFVEAQETDKDTKNTVLDDNIEDVPLKGSEDMDIDKLKKMFDEFNPETQEKMKNMFINSAPGSKKEEPKKAGTGGLDLGALGQLADMAKLLGLGEKQGKLKKTGTGGLDFESLGNIGDVMKLLGVGLGSNQGGGIDIRTLLKYYEMYEKYKHFVPGNNEGKPSATVERTEEREDL